MRVANIPPILQVSVDNDPRYLGEDSDDDDDDDGNDHLLDAPGIAGYIQQDGEVDEEEDEDEDSDPEEADIDDVDSNGLGYDQETQVGEGAGHYNTDPRRSVERFLGVVSTISMPFGTGETGRRLLNQLQAATQLPQRHFEWANDSSQGSVSFYTGDGPFVPGEHLPIGGEPFTT